MVEKKMEAAATEAQSKIEAIEAKTQCLKEALDKA